MLNKEHAADVVVIKLIKDMQYRSLSLEEGVGGRGH